MILLVKPGNFHENPIQGNQGKHPAKPVKWKPGMADISQVSFPCSLPGEPGGLLVWKFPVCRTKTRQTLRFPRLDKIKIVVTQVPDPGNFPRGGSYSDGEFEEDQTMGILVEGRPGA